MTDSNFVALDEHGFAKSISEMTETEAFEALRAAKIEKNTAQGRRVECVDALDAASQEIKQCDDVIASKERRIQLLVQRLNDAPSEVSEEDKPDDANAITQAVADMVAEDPEPAPCFDKGDFQKCEACETPTTCRVNQRCELTVKPDLKPCFNAPSGYCTTPATCSRFDAKCAFSPVGKAPVKADGEDEEQGADNAN